MIKKAKSIKQLYEEIKSFDLVITVDAPLRTALNKLLNRPVLGMFAVTPKELASEYAVQNLRKPLLDESVIVLEIAANLDLNIKQAHHNVRRIFDIWQSIGKVEQVGRYLTNSGRAVLDIAKTLPTVYSALEQFDQSVLLGKCIAVVGLDFFTELDRSVLPGEYTKIDVFTTEEYRLPELYTFTSEKDVVDRVVSMIDRENADDIAIVLNPGSSHLPLVRSRLANRNISLNIKGQLGNHFLTREILRLIETGMNLNDLVVGEIVPFASLLSLHIDPGYSNYLLSEYMGSINEDSGLTKLYDFLINIAERTYVGVMDWLRDREIEPPIEFMDVLEQLGMRDQIVDFDSYSSLAYYMENFEVEIPGSKSGVLLVNCKNSAYVNRPVCFFLGMDVSWARDASEEWLDNKSEDTKSLDMFQILLQQGQCRYYLVSTMKDNQKVTPCHYFNVLLKPAIESFTDPVFATRGMSSIEDTDEWESSAPNIETEPYAFTHFSQSTLNAFTICPKRYAYERLTHSEEQTYFLKGNLLHNFAAFYLNYPDVVESKGDGFFVDQMIKEYKEMVSDMKIDAERTLFNIGVQNIRSFIDALDVREDIELDVTSASRQSKENRFARLLGVSIDSKNSEPEFVDDALGIRGIFDVIVDHSTVVDYKSGMTKKSASAIVRGANLKLTNDSVDFQPILYILQLRKFSTGPICFLYHYCLGNHKDVINGVADPDDGKVTVRYYPFTFNEFLQSEDAIALLASSKGRIKIIDTLGSGSLNSFFRQNPISAALQFDVQQLLENEYRDIFSDYIFEGMGKRNAALQNDIDSFLKTIVAFRTGNRQKTALLFKEDLDAFEIFIQEKLAEMNAYLEDGFPAQPLSRNVCKECSCGDVCLDEL